ncbi:MAG: hypothetical protein JSR65_08445 [Proteobacteria bacterium]|nr:hypothetical protein [Pseudomonadota bacterium]
MLHFRRPRFRLQCLARGVFARVVVPMLALSLMLANPPMEPMPASAVAGRGAQTTALSSASAHHHCDDAVATKQVLGRPAVHDTHCSCCAVGDCACLHATPGVLAVMLAWFDMFPSIPLLPPREVTLIDVDGERRLRPPIA